MARSMSLLLMACCWAVGSNAGVPCAGQAVPRQLEELAIEAELPNFELKDFNGKTWRPDDFQKSRQLAVVFFGTECPLVKLYAGKLNQLVAEHDSTELQIVGINSNQQDSLAEIRHFARTNQVDFPLLKDPGNRVADLFGATRTPEVYLFDATRRLQYRGQIDDQYTYGLQRLKVDNRFLQSAIRSVKAGQPPRIQVTEAVGCHIGRLLQEQKDTTVTYANQISRIIQNRCVNCHRNTEIAPFSLQDFDQVVGWAEMIREVVNERRMPPWHAEGGDYEFKNEAKLSEAEIRQINQWVASGAPFGNPVDLPKPKQFATGWQIGQPDAVVRMSDRPFRVPATGVVPYKHFVVDPGFQEDKWIRAAECRAGNRAVVHHIIVAIHQGGDRETIHDEVDSEWITATAPGAPPMILPDGYAKRVPAGSKLIFQLHYTPNGTATTDISEVGFVFADPASVKKTVGTRQVVNRRFRIPAGAENHEVRAVFDQFDRDALLLSTFPHMHLRGKSFRYIAHFPDGSRKTLLNIPRYDFNWQNNYQFLEPVRIPAGTRLECIAHYDNSERNLANPDPEQVVRWGDQTWDEMMIGYFNMVWADPETGASQPNPRTQTFLEGCNGIDESRQVHLARLAEAGFRSQSKMKKFGLALQQSFPQIDRACWTAIDDAKLKVQRVVQTAEFARHLKGLGVERSASGCRLAELAGQSDPVAIDDLASQRHLDLQYMGSLANSSFHIPIEISGQRGTINFWSAEPGAFPPQAQRLLIRIAEGVQR